MSGASGPAARVTRDPLPDPITPVSLVVPAMGGRLGVHIDPGQGEAAGRGDEARRDAARRDAALATARALRWAGRLSRHASGSELTRLDADPRTDLAIGPTLGAALQAAREACDLGEGLVDVTLLDARLAAEGLEPEGSGAIAARSWTIRGSDGRRSRLHRDPGVRFDLDGVAKGWIADRALALLAPWPSAIVDADGDLAVRGAPGRSWQIGIDDPRGPGALLAVLALAAPAGMCPSRWGVATSGTSIHRWRLGDTSRHHLIDPRTAAPAVTDVVQATDVCETALAAEVLAKAAVIAGSLDGLGLLERASVAGAVMLTERDEVLALPSTLALLADDRAA